MKSKFRILSIILALAFMLQYIPTAFAEEVLPASGTVEAGSAADTTGEAGASAITGISFGKEIYELPAGGTIKADIYSTDTSGNKAPITSADIAFKAGDESIAKIDQQGNISGVLAGQTEITVKYGSLEAKAAVKVMEVKKVKEIAFEKAQYDIKKGGSITAVLYAVFTDGTKEPLALGSSIKPEIISSDTTIATVDEKGDITAIEKGQSVITVKVGEYTAQTTVNVVDGKIATGIDFERKQYYIEKGGSINTALYMIFNDGTGEPLVLDSSLKTEFISSDTAIAIVDEKGNITGVEKGQAVITVKMGEYTAQTVANVVDERIITGIEFGKDTYEVTTGTSIKVDIYTIDSTGAKKILNPSPDISFGISDENIAKIDSEGILTGILVGQAQLTVKYAGYEAKADVKVLDEKKLKEITFEKEQYDIKKGDSLTVTLYAVYMDGTKEPLALGPSIKSEFLSSDTAIVTIDEKGTIKAIEKGEALISVKAGEYKAQTKVVVGDEKEIKEISFSNAEYELTVGETLQAQIKVTYADMTSEVLNADITYTSSDEKIASIDKKGVITAKGEGKAEITAAYKKFTAIAKVTVAALLKAPVLELTEQDSNVLLSWQAVDGALSYNVYRGPSPGKLSLISTEISETSYVDNSIDRFNVNCYAVTAVKGKRESSRSDIKTTTPVPEAPLLYGLMKKDGIRLDWTYTQDSDTFTLSRKAGDESSFKVIADGIKGNFYMDTLTDQNKTWYYMVTAYDKQGRPGRSSSEIKIIPDESKPDNFEQSAESEINKPIMNKTGVKIPDDSVKSLMKGNVPKKVKKQAASINNNLNVVAFGGDNLANAPLNIKDSDDTFLSSLKGAVGAPVEVDAGGIEINTATISIKYDPKKLKGIPEEDLKIYWVDRENGKLVPLNNAKLDKKSMTVSAVTTHFSTYVLGSFQHYDLSKVDIEFSIDSSDNMKDKDPNNYRNLLARRFFKDGEADNLVNLVPDGTPSSEAVRIGFTEFSDYANIKLLPINSTEELDSTYGLLRKPSGATNMAEGLWVASAGFQSADRRKILFLITDGKDTCGNSDEALSKIVQGIYDNGKSNLVINTIAVGNDSNTELLQEIAQLTNGSYFKLNIGIGTTQSDIESQIEAIYNKVVKQVTLGNYVKPPENVEQQIKKISDYDNYKGYDSEQARALYTKTHANMVSGNYLDSASDIAVGDMKIERIYNSDDADKLTMLGNGWRLNYDSTAKPMESYTIVTAGTLNFRQGPGTGYAIISVLPYGKTVKKLSGQQTADGYVWQQVEVDGAQGYVVSQYIQDVKTSAVKVTYGSGTEAVFAYENGVYGAPFGIYDKLEKTSSGYTLTKKDQTKYIYNSNGDLGSIKDRYGNTISISRDSNGKITGVSDAVGRSLSFEYNTGTNLLWKISDGLGRNVEYVYDNDKNLIGVFDLSSNKITYSYYGKTKDIPENVQYKLKQETDQNGHQVFKNEYDIYGRLVKQYDANNCVSYNIYRDAYKNENGEYYTDYEQMYRIQVDKNGNATKYDINPVTGKIMYETDSNGRAVTHTYYMDFGGTLGWMDTTYMSDDPNSKYPLRTQAYQKYLSVTGNGNVPEKEKITDKHGYNTTYEYDGDGNLISQTDDNGQAISMHYNSNNDLVSKIDKEGNITVYVYTPDASYDPNGLYLKKVRDPEGNIVQYSYYKVGEASGTSGISIKLAGLVKSETKSLKGKDGKVVNEFNATTYKYGDKYNNRTETIDALGNSTLETHDLAGRLLTVTDANNKTTKYTYDKMNRITAVEDPFGNGEITQYSKAGNKISQTNKNGDTTQYAYYDNNLLKEVKDPLGFSIQYKYDNMGNKTDEINQKGGITHYEYDELGRLIHMTDPVGFTTAYRYDVSAQGKKDEKGYNNTEVTDPYGNVTITEYDNLYRKTKERQILTNLAGGEKVTTYTYDVNDNVEAVTDSMGKVTKSEYDKIGRVTKVSDGYGLSDTSGKSLQSDTSYEYDAYEKEGVKLQSIKKTDSLGKASMTVTDELGRKVSETNAEQQTTSYIYDPLGNLKETTDPRQNKTTYEYDAMNRVKGIYDAKGKYTEMEYDAVGNNTAKTDRMGNRTVYSYDPDNRLIQTKDPLGSISVLTYDEAGNIKTRTDAEGNMTSYEYDRNNRLISETDADGYTRYYRYNAYGNKTFESTKRYPSLGRHYEYDELNRLSKVTDEEDSDTSYTYDLMGNMLVKTDGKGQTTRYAYDGMYRLKTLTDPLNMTEIYEHDTVGNVVSKIDRTGKTTSYLYDNLYRVTTETAGNDTRSKTYDAAGNLETTTDATGTTTYVYDNLNRLETKLLPGNKEIDYEYDAEGNVTSLTDPDINQTAYTYDSASRVKTVTTAQGTTTYDYYTNRNRKSLTLPNGVTTTYGYNRRNLLVSMDNGTQGTYSYDYDADGLQKSKTEPKGTTNFEYDGVGRVIRITEPGGRVTTYTYDDAGNRETQTVTASDLQAGITYVYDECNRLIETNETRNGQVTNNSYTFDNSGNLRCITENGNSTMYAYDGFDQLKIAIMPGGKVMTCLYDALGQRARKTIGGVTTNYYYDGQDVILETGSNGRTNRYVYGTSLIGMDDGSGIAYYMYNGHGDVVGLVKDGALINQYDYDIFGNPILSTEAKSNPYRYSGYFYDSETGYYYLNARYYDPKTARFITEDTYSGEYTDPLSLNLYTYCYNEPIMNYDPLGHAVLVYVGGEYYAPEEIYEPANQQRIYVNTEFMNRSDISDFAKSTVYNSVHAADAEFAFGSHTSENDDVRFFIDFDQCLADMIKDNPKKDPRRDASPSVINEMIRRLKTYNCGASFTTVSHYLNDIRLNFASGMTSQQIYALASAEGFQQMGMNSQMLYFGSSYGRQGVNSKVSVGGFSEGTSKTIPDVADSQLGKKLVDHAADYGLTKSKEGAAAYKQITQNVLQNATTVKTGNWKTLGECEFWISGNDVAIVKDGNWISTFPLNKPGTVDYINSLPIKK